MAVEFALAEAGKVLATSQHACGAKPCEELARIANRFAGVGRDRARTHHAARRFKREIEHGSEVNVESEGAAVLSDDLPVFAEEFAVTGGEDICCRRSWPERIAEAVYVSAFEIDAGKQRRGNALLAIAQESPGLLRSLNVAREQDHARPVSTLEYGSEARSHL